MQPTSLNPHTYDNGTSSEMRRYGNIMDVKEVLSKYRSILCCVCGGGIAAKKIGFVWMVPHVQICHGSYFARQAGVKTYCC